MERALGGSPRRVLAVLAAAIVAAALAPLTGATPAGATPGQTTAPGQTTGPSQTTAPGSTTAPGPTTAGSMPATTAWVLVDADTGNVVSASNDRVPLPPASLTKVITALAASTLAPDTSVTVSPLAAAAPPDKIGLVAGQVWTADELFHALLISSANDAAMALAQQVGGSMAGFQTIFARTAQELGMVDHPTLMDPAGLDGSEGLGGGNRVSARDLAIAGRALLANPYLAQIVATQLYPFTGPGGVPHRLVSHDLAFLSSYPGAIGIKTGFTDRAGTCLMAAARRNGRTMLAVVLHSANPTAAAKLLLDQGFATPVSAESTVGRLPAVDLAALRPTTVARVRAGVAAAGPLHPAPGPASTSAPVTASDRLTPKAVAAITAPQPTNSFGLLEIGGLISLLGALLTYLTSHLFGPNQVGPNEVAPSTPQPSR